MATQEEMLAQQKAQCPFCKIVGKEMDSHIVYEDDLFMAVLDINPAAKGHVLFFPKEHYPIIATIPPPVFTKMAQTVQTVSKKIQNAMLSQGTDIFIASGQAAGQQIFHFSLHLIPREEGDGLTKFQLPGTTLDPESLKKTKEMLSANLKKIMAGKFQSAEPMNKEKLLEMIEQNPQLKTIILEKPDHFRELVKKHPQLQGLFKDVNVEEIIAAVTGKKKEGDTKEKTKTKEEQTKEKTDSGKEGKQKSKQEEKKDTKKKDKDSSLDDISGYLKGL